MVKTAGKRVKIYQWTENGLDIQVTKKAIRNMYLRVGADGSIRVSAPLKMPECDIRRFIRERMDWIEEHRKKKGQNLPPWEIYEGREREAKKQECRMRLEKILPRVIQVHLLERGHNGIFYGYMDVFYPRWKDVKTRLNSGVQP